MGHGLIVKCKKCKTEKAFNTGIGMAFPSEYKDITDGINKGDYGKEWQAFFEENPGPAVNANRSIYQCEACHELVEEYNLSLYNNKKGNPPEHGVCFPWELSEGGYEFVKEYEHRCPKCGKVMRRIDEGNVPSLPCPKCGRKLIIVDEVMWD